MSRSPLRRSPAPGLVRVIVTVVLGLAFVTGVLVLTGTSPSTAAAADSVARGSAVLVVRGTAVVPDGRSLGLAWSPAPANPFRIAVGRPPAARDEVVLDVATAQQHRVGLGDRVTVVTGAGAHELTVVGAVRHGDAPGLPDATVALLEPGTARQWFGPGA